MVVKHENLRKRCVVIRAIFSIANRDPGRVNNLGYARLVFIQVTCRGGAEGCPGVHHGLLLAGCDHGLPEKGGCDPSF